MEYRNYSIDSLKFFCILGVIAIHTNPFGGIELNFIGSRYIGIIINTIVRVCVPLFFVSSGYFFYNKCNKEYMKKYTMNLIKILASWIVIYILYNISINVLSNLINSRFIFDGIVDFFSGFNLLNIYYATGIVKYHLWYLSAMIIIIPTLYFVIDKNLVDKSIKVSLILNIIGVLIPVFISADLWYRVRDALFFGLFYVLLGVYIKKYECEFKKKIEQISTLKYIAVIIILFGISIIERYIYLSVFNGAGDYFISTIPLSIFIFGICIVNINLFKGSIINKLGKNTLGIYVIHPLIMEIVSLLLHILNIEWISNTLIWQIIYTPTVLIVSFISYKIIQVPKRLILNLTGYDNTYKYGKKKSDKAI